MDAERDRTLRMEIPSTIGNRAPPALDWTLSNGWVNILDAGAPSGLVAWSGSIDLSGYARDYKTFYPAGGVIQQGPYVAETLGEGLIMYTVVSSVPINTTNLLYTLSANSSLGLLTGSVNPIDGYDWTTIVFAESQLYVPNANIVPNTFGILQPLETQQTGSLSPTAAQVLYVVKVAWPISVGSTVLSIPASRVILPGTMDQEPELEYMMRLSRSVELANQV